MMVLLWMWVMVLVVDISFEGMLDMLFQILLQLIGVWWLVCVVLVIVIVMVRDLILLILLVFGWFLFVQVVLNSLSDCLQRLCVEQFSVFEFLVVVRIILLIGCCVMMFFVMIEFLVLWILNLVVVWVWVKFLWFMICMLEGIDQIDMQLFLIFCLRFEVVVIVIILIGFLLRWKCMVLVLCMVMLGIILFLVVGLLICQF